MGRFLREVDEETFIDVGNLGQPADLHQFLSSPDESPTKIKEEIFGKGSSQTSMRCCTRELLWKTVSSELRPAFSIQSSTQPILMDPSV